jgi:hypothetical protein
MLSAVIHKGLVGEFWSRITLLLAQPLPEGLGRFAPGAESLGEQRQVVARAAGAGLALPPARPVGEARILGKAMDTAVEDLDALKIRARSVYVSERTMCITADCSPWGTRCCFGVGF